MKGSGTRSATTRAPAAAAPSILPVLCYHAVTDAAHPRAQLPRGARGYAVSREALRRQLAAVLDDGFVPIAGSLLAAVASGLAAPPARAFALTFDDALSTHLEVASPVLAELGVPATFFLDTDSLGTAGRMRWSQALRLLEQGHCLGSHGVTHRFLSGLSPAGRMQELLRSQAVIEARLGARAGLFAAPGGRHDRACLVAARAAGYRAFFTTAPGLNEVPTGRFAWERIVVRTGTTTAELQRLFAGHRPTLVRALLAYRIRARVRGVLGDPTYDFLQKAFKP